MGFFSSRSFPDGHLFASPSPFGVKTSVPDQRVESGSDLIFFLNHWVIIDLLVPPPILELEFNSFRKIPMIFTVVLPPGGTVFVQSF